MSKQARESQLERLHKLTSKRSMVGTIDREYSLLEIAAVTRAGQAVALGMSDTKGHLGVGADADVAIYDLDPNNLTPDNIEKAFSRAAYTIKDGVIVVQNGEIVSVTQGKRSWVNPQVNENLEKTLLRDIRRTFARFYTVTMANFPVQDMYVPISNEIKIDATNIA